MRNILVIISLLSATVAWGQRSLTIEECYERAEANYPLTAQRGLIEKTKAFSIGNASKSHRPQIMLGGQATYQSDVTQIPLEMPGIEPLDKDQYRFFGEISQTLYHGGLVGEQKKSEEVNGEMELQKLEVELYQLRNRINELFFGILLLQDQISQSRLVKDDLGEALKKTEAGIRNGTVLRSAAEVLRAEILRVDQRIIELESAEKSFREILGMFMNQPLEDNTILRRPEWIAGSDINRPELRLFELQKQGIESNRLLLSARRRPRVELFLQSGYGRPALNMLDNSFDFYYLGGIRFQWMLSGYYTLRRENEILDLRQQSLDIQKETFLFNTRLTSRQHDAEIAKLQQLIRVDEEIIALRESVRKTASAQLEAGVISSADYIREVNAADQAKQNRVLHETQLLMAQAKLRFTTGQ